MIARHCHMILPAANTTAGDLRLVGAVPSAVPSHEMIGRTTTTTPAWFTMRHFRMGLR
jgi:hypothetical protein